MSKYSQFYKSEKLGQKCNLLYFFVLKWCKISFFLQIMVIFPKICHQFRENCNSNFLRQSYTKYMRLFPCFYEKSYNHKLFEIDLHTWKGENFQVYLSIRDLGLWIFRSDDWVDVYLSYMLGFYLLPIPNEHI